MDRKDNLQSRLVTYAQGARNLSRREPFKRGYDEALKSKPYDYDIPEKRDAVDYARGRAFGIWTIAQREKTCRWKNGVLSRAGEERLLRAMYDRAII
jgi:hypothetical protein